jgi:D-threo-aldose 1-dehydrogenase
MTIPVLGFGTAAIMGRVSRRAGTAALERALAAGVRHFDTARSYGGGEAERVGAALRGHPREDLRIVTTCGILPVRNTPVLGLAKSVARSLLAFAPGLKAQVRRVASSESFQPVRTYEIGSLAGSLKTSLAELGVSYIDDLLLHNYTPDRPGLQEVGAWFRELQRAGTIRRFGFSVEGDLLQGLEHLAAEDLLTDAIVQVPVSQTLLDLPREWRGVRFIAHSPFGFMRRQQETDAPLTSLAALLPALGDACRCEALVCSMFGADHLTANVAAWKSCS